MTEEIMRFWWQRFDTASMAKFLLIPEYQVERLLHTELERRWAARQGAA